jgi:hypothetical protein
MRTIQQRVEKAQKCLNNYDEPNEVYAVIDLLTDLVHLCRENGYDLDKELEMAKSHAHEEVRQQRWSKKEEEDEDERINGYANWEALVVTNLARQIDCTYQDAMDIIEAQDFYLAQSWGKGLSPEETARIIDEKSKA